MTIEPDTIQTTSARDMGGDPCMTAKPILPSPLPRPRPRLAGGVSGAEAAR